MIKNTADRLGAALGDHYRVERQIGAGATATVYRARDRRHDRDVALKVLRSELASSVELRHRFARETRALTSLSHPNIVGVVD